MTFSGEWLTIAQAARRLGVSDRTGRRYAAKLADSDRQLADIGPIRVRLDALAFLMQSSPTLKNSRQTPHFVTDSLADGSQSAGGQVTDSWPAMPEREPPTDSRLFEQMRGEIDYLRGALEREQQSVKEANAATRDALARLEEAERRGQVLIAAAAQGRLTTLPETKPNESEPRAGERVGASGNAENPARSEEVSPPQEEKRPGFWARLWRKT